MTVRACKLCEWYEPKRVHAPGYGYCKKRAPVTSIINSEPEWPSVHEDEWCGDYEIKTEKIEVKNLLRCRDCFETDCKWADELRVGENYKCFKREIDAEENTEKEN